MKLAAKVISAWPVALHGNIPLSLRKVTFIVIPIPAGVTELLKFCKELYQFEYEGGTA